MTRLTSNPESPSVVSAYFNLEWLKMMIVALMGVAFTTLWAVFAGQDMNWNLRNYHYYSKRTSRLLKNAGNRSLSRWAGQLGSDVLISLHLPSRAR